jgi:selenocysteine lyase/cysteine desulfurase
VDGVHHDLAAAILNNEAVIATRNGCFCAHPYLHHLLGVKDVEQLVARLSRGEDTELPGAVRASIGLFNTPDEVDWLVSWVRKLTRREWSGRYDLEKRDYCKPVFFEFDGRTGLSGTSQHATARV